MERPSWHWVGADVARELSSRHQVSLFRKKTGPGRCDVAVFVKEIPTADELAALRRAGAKAVYLPVDFFRDELHVEESSAALGMCSAVAVHCERLRPLVEPHCPRVELVEHHNRHGVDPAARRPKGGALWIGFSENLGPAAAWLSSEGAPWDVTVLTDIPRKAVAALAGARVTSLAVRGWTERSQEICLMEAEAGFDVKGASFGQRHKPPTKAQQFLCSGIPFAADRDGYAREHLLRQGLEVAELSDHARLASPEYAREVLGFSALLRERLSLSSVARSLERVLKTL